VKGEEDEMMALFRQQRLIASNDDPEDTPGFNAEFMSSLNDHAAWAGNIEDVIALSIRDKGGHPSTSHATTTKLAPAAW
jgi:hypothetical protein